MAAIIVARSTDGEHRCGDCVAGERPCALCDTRQGLHEALVDNARLRAEIERLTEALSRSESLRAQRADEMSATIRDLESAFWTARERAVKLRAALWAVRDVTAEEGSPSHETATTALTEDDAKMESAPRSDRTDIESLRSEISSREKRLRVLETAERRRWQATDLATHGEPVRWLGDIGQFCEDLVFHATELGRAVRGAFNNVPIVAASDSDPRVLEASYWHRRQP